MGFPWLFGVAAAGNADALVSALSQARGHDHFTARFTRNALANAGLRRQARQCVLSHIKELRRVVRKHELYVIPAALVLWHITDSRRVDRPKAQANGSAVGTSSEGEDHLPVVAEKQVALAERAAGQHLNGVHGAGVVLDDGDEFLVLRAG